jgi:hypothetical protein
VSFELKKLAVDKTVTGTDPTPGDELSYSFRPSVLGAPRNFRLSAHTLEWDIGRRSGRLAFDRVTRVRMSFRPVTLQNHRFVTEIWSTDGPRLDIVSSSWKSMVEQIRLDHDYRIFISELHRRLAAAGTQARFDTGTNPLTYWAGLAVFVATGLALAFIITRAVQSRAIAAALLVGAFLAAFLWQAGNFFRRNRPGRYRPGALPAELLPKG